MAGERQKHTYLARERRGKVARQGREQYKPHRLDQEA
jgi:hypothetical protein